MDILNGLNDGQREAVTTTEGFVRVIAGAGSGKTRALARRFAWLVMELGILPGSILCVTFTNKSAGEMQRRIHTLIGDNDTGIINTFHGFCLSVLQEEAHVIQYPKSFMVLDNADIDAMLRLIYEERGLSLRHMTFAAARDLIEMRKTLTEPDYYRALTALSPEPLRQRYEEAAAPEDIIFCGYLYQEKKCFGLDYNDLIKLTLHVFEDPDIRLKWQARLEYIMIDEFQDIDRLQYQLMTVLCGCHKNLFIVGDPDQTIYTWRGANVNYLLNFGKAFPNVKTILMTKNYRSTPQILAAANSLIAKNRLRVEKSLVSTLADGAPVMCLHAENPGAEAAWIAEEIKGLREKGAAFRDMTVLYRAHHVARAVEASLLKENIPYAVYSGAPFFERREIRDALAYLRMVAFRDDLSFLRVANVPRRNLGERRMKFLQERAVRDGCTLWEALLRTSEDEIFRGTHAGRFIALIEGLAADCESRPVSELLADILDASGYEEMLRTEGAQDRLDNLAELRQSVHEYEVTCGEEATLPGYLAHAALFAGGADADGPVDRVRLMTIHTAKGLEFPYVFLCGMNEGIFPSRKTRTLEGMEEERRLAFVAMTRAQKRLFLSGAGGKNFDGSPRYPSRFLLDIDEGLLSFIRRPGDDLVTDAREYIAFSEHWLTRGAGPQLLSVGQRVRHPTFGEGAILEVDRSRSAYLIRFDGLPTPRAISFRARLEAQLKS